MPDRHGDLGREKENPAGAATITACEHPEGGEDPGGYRPSFRQRGNGHGARRAGVPGRGRRHRDGGRHPGPAAADARAGPCDGHRGPHLGPGRVHRRAGLLRGCGLQPAGVADQQDPHHQGRRGRLYRVGPPRRRASGGRGRAGFGGDVGVVRADDLRLDGQAPGGEPGGRGCDSADGRGEGDGPAGPGRAGRGDLRPVPARQPG